MFFFPRWNPVSLKRLCANLPRKFFGFLLVIGFCILLLIVKNPKSACTEFLKVELVGLYSKIAFLDSVIRAKDDYIFLLQSSNYSKFETEVFLKGNISKTRDSLQPEVAELLKNISGTRTAACFYRENLPLYRPLFLNQLMPHLMQNSRSLQPAFLMSAGRKYADIVVGVPTIKRVVTSYLIETLEGLIGNLSPSEANVTLIVVFIGDADPITFLNTALQIEKKFAAQLDSGLIDVLAPDSSYYPDLNTLLPSRGDSVKRYRWRTKQNLDIIYTMAYSYLKGRFYLMMEDDIYSTRNYIHTILKKVSRLGASHPSWVIVAFSEALGYGTLFRSANLAHFITYTQLFYINLPIDWLIPSYIDDLICTHLTKNTKHCYGERDHTWIVQKTIFKHMGTYSSLHGKMHQVTEKRLIPGLKLFVPHQNPPVSHIESDIKPHLHYTIESAYKGTNFFWGVSPKRNNFIIFEFEEPVMIKRFKFLTGNGLHAYDKLYQAVVEVKPSRSFPESRFEPIAYFDELGMAESTLFKDIGLVDSLRIRLLQDSYKWLVISEIEITTYN